MIDVTLRGNHPESPVVVGDNLCRDQKLTVDETPLEEIPNGFLTTFWVGSELVVLVDWLPEQKLLHQCTQNSAQNLNVYSVHKSCTQCTRYT